MAQWDWVQKHMDRYIATNGEDGHIWSGADGTLSVPCLLLTTTGRKSGDAKMTALIYGMDGDTPVIIASKGGQPAHPLWYLNIEANAEVTVQIKGDVFKARAEVVSGPERSTLWAMMAEIFPRYNDYHESAKATREIPVVALKRI